MSANASLLLILLAAGALLAKDPRRARGFALMLLAGSALSLALYYRDFLAPWLTGSDASAGVKGAGAGSGFENPLLRLQAVFGTGFVLAGIGGAFLLWRIREARPLVASWALAGAALLAARSVVPLVRFAHEELWLAPLVCLAAGQVVAWLWSRGTVGRALAVIAAAGLVTSGALLQWRALAAQLHPAG